MVLNNDSKRKRGVIKSEQEVNSEQSSISLYLSATANIPHQSGNPPPPPPTELWYLIAGSVLPSVPTLWREQQRDSHQQRHVKSRACRLDWGRLSWILGETGSWEQTGWKTKVKVFHNFGLGIVFWKVTVEQNMNIKFVPPSIRWFWLQWWLCRI